LSVLGADAVVDDVVVDVVLVDGVVVDVVLVDVVVDVVLVDAVLVDVDVVVGTPAVVMACKRRNAAQFVRDLSHHHRRPEKSADVSKPRRTRATTATTSTLTCAVARRPA
jgi:hypothetical protein